jgi:histone-lysine N-methyltransferase SETMAR
MKNKVRTGSPLLIDPEKLRTVVESNPSTTTRELSVELQTSSSTVFCHLKMLGKINRGTRDVPHDLTQQQQQEQRRVQICKEKKSF